MARVLVVERREVSRAAALLEREGFVVLTAVEGVESIAVLQLFEPDLVLVEAASPSQEVLELCARVRAAASVALVLVCGPHSERDAVAVFGAGVDGLVTDSVGPHEFVARLRAVLRRSPLESDAAKNVITVGPVVLDLARRELCVNGVEVRIPRREFDIAELLMRDAGRVVPRQTIVRELWGSVRDTKSLDVQVGRLRTRLSNIEGKRRIVTVRGVGFRFLLDGDPEFVEQVASAPSVDRADETTTEEEAPRSDELCPQAPCADVLEGSASA